MSLLDWFKVNDTGEDYHEVTVEKGESLWGIAKEITGEGERWQELADANPEHGWDKYHTIQPGDVLRVPKSWG